MKIFQLLNLLEKKMHDLDGKLQEAENFSNQWKPIHIDIVQDQSDNMKVFYDGMQVLVRFS